MGEHLDHRLRWVGNLNGTQPHQSGPHLNYVQSNRQHLKCLLCRTGEMPHGPSVSAHFHSTKHVNNFNFIKAAEAMRLVVGNTAFWRGKLGTSRANDYGPQVNYVLKLNGHFQCLICKTGMIQRHDAAAHFNSARHIHTFHSIKRAESEDPSRSNTSASSVVAATPSTHGLSRIPDAGSTAICGESLASTITSRQHQSFIGHGEQCVMIPFSPSVMDCSEVMALGDPRLVWVGKLYCPPTSEHQTRPLYTKLSLNGEAQCLLCGTGLIQRHDIQAHFTSERHLKNVTFVKQEEAAVAQRKDLKYYR